jgi:hypothetical protein
MCSSGLHFIGVGGGGQKLLVDFPTGLEQIIWHCGSFAVLLQSTLSGTH